MFMDRQFTRPLSTGETTFVLPVATRVFGAYRETRVPNNENTRQGPEVTIN